MTVREIYEQGVKDLPATDQLRLASLILEGLTGLDLEQELRGRLEKATRSNEQLLALAGTHPAPQSWWDETEDPTLPAVGK